jgi:flavin reductase (DIM6/NTAB) family NADH-FMN oxidoreductase RutF
MILKPVQREGVMPLPVTFVSTIGIDGIRNIAPWSCVMPILRPLDLICLASAYRRDTLANIRDTGEFVVNWARAAQTDKVIPAARHVPPEVDEFELAGIEEKPSHVVKPPGMAGCFAWMECTTEKLFEEPDYVLIVGRVVHLETADDALTPEGALDLSTAQPLMMTGLRKGMHFCTPRDINRFEPFSAMFEDGRDPFDK